ncbi:MAG: TonB-dependent receptor [Sphingobium sp.]|nr:TonB-dependent receptor [Sphingobium sp.]
MSLFRCRAISLLCMTAAFPAPLLAQDDMPPPDTTADAKEAPVPSEKRIFTPADFTRFAPKTAMDMVNQLPSFSVRSADTSRGLGQASENVLINGQRITDKSGGAIDRLRNVPASDVLRIEVQEAAALGIPGLTGQIANVILKDERKASGRIEWSPRVRPDYAKPALLRGKITYTGNSGKLDYTIGLQNYGNRGAIGGADYVVQDANGVQTEQRDQQVQFNYDNARVSTLLKYGGKGPFQANLNLIYNPYWQRNINSQRRNRTDDRDNNWLTRGRISGYSFSASGDISFPLMGGTLKAIGVRSSVHEPFLNVQTTDYDSAAYPDEGVRFGRDSRTGETIGRIEYHWKGGKNDWELSLERAYNSLDQRGSLAILQPSGLFQDTPFPQGSGVVAEKRYEAILSLSRPLSANLDLQLVGGGELSRLRHVDRNEPTRKFFRPKGSISLAWRPAKGWDASLKFERKVGQINFYDFLAQPDLVLDKENDANPDLVPPQSWQLTAEIGRNFGEWGKTRLKIYGHRIDDIVDFIPIGTDGQAVGNLPRATRFGVEPVSTLQLDPVGWKGAKLDVTIGGQHTRVRDPLTGANRPISNDRNFWAYVNFRHDIPKSQVAWGAYFNIDHYGSAYYLNEINRNWEGPYFGVFIEHKDLAGMKVTFDAFNITDARNHFDRTVYGGRRNVAPVIFREQQRQRVSQIFTLTAVKTF